MNIGRGQELRMLPQSTYHNYYSHFLKSRALIMGQIKMPSFSPEKRIQLYMKSLLCLPNPQKCMPPVPGGLTVIQQELEVLGSQYANIVNLNKQVYGPFYANILRKLLFSEEATGKAEASSSTN